jgi:hypothetical protein
MHPSFNLAKVQGTNHSEQQAYNCFEGMKQILAMEF